MGKTLRKFLGIASLIAMTTLFPFKKTNAQFFNPDTLKGPSVPIVVNGPTPLEKIENFYSQPNIQVQLPDTTQTDTSKIVGWSPLHWYGSGDVNNDGRVDSLDVKAIESGVANDMSDVNGDGVTNQQDAQMILNYLNGKISHLPAYWNEDSVKERESWLEKVLKIQPAIPSGDLSNWLCQDFTKWYELNFYGISNLNAFIQWNLAGTGVDYTGKVTNARFNIPVVTVSDFYFANGNREAHAVAGVLVGDSTNNTVSDTVFSNYRFFYFYGDSIINVKPGDPDMDANSPVSISKLAYVKSVIYGTNLFTNLNNLITFNLTNGKGTLVNYDKRFLTLNNPNILKVHAGNPQTFNVDGTKVTASDTSLPFGYLTSQGFNVVGDTSTQNNPGDWPLNVSLAKSDKVYSADSTSFTQGLKEHVWIYRGGVTKSDSVENKIVVNNLIGNTHLNLKSIDDLVLDANKITNGNNLTPSDLTPEYLKSIGDTSFVDTTGLSPNIPVKWFYKDSNLNYSSDSTSFSFDREYFGERTSFGETRTDSTAKPQKITLSNITAVENPFPTAPKNYELYQNYPNPFNPTTTIKYSIPEESKVSLKVYNTLGQEVKTLVDKVESSGNYSVNFSENDLASGVYIYRIDAKSDVSKKHYSKVEKMILLK